MNAITFFKFVLHIPALCQTTVWTVRQCRCLLFVRLQVNNVFQFHVITHHSEFKKNCGTFKHLSVFKIFQVRKIRIINLCLSPGQQYSVTYGFGPHAICCSPWKLPLATEKCRISFSCCIHIQFKVFRAPLFLNLPFIKQ